VKKNVDLLLKIGGGKMPKKGLILKKEVIHTENSGECAPGIHKKK